jgi:Mn-dependent DtxR family transcriptional regulator
MSKKNDYRDRILNFLNKGKVVTTTEVAERFKLSWNTAEKCLLEIALEGKATRMKKAGVNLWVYNGK